MKDLRKKHGSHEANILLARLPMQRRSLTIIGTDSISISCSPDVDCNLLICLVGIHIKVGHPVPWSANKKPVSASQITYAWQTVTHSFDTFLELKGILPILVWSVNFDYYWPARKLSLNLTTTEIEICLSPEHLQTLLLHLDDYIDSMSPYNVWYYWLYENLQQELKKQQELLGEIEKKRYCCSFAQLKGAKLNEDSSKNCVGSGDHLTPLQMKEAETKMTRFEILSLRCLAMESGKQPALFVSSPSPFTQLSCLLLQRVEHTRVE